LKYIKKLNIDFDNWVWIDNINNICWYINIIEGQIFIMKYIINNDKLIFFRNYKNYNDKIGISMNIEEIPDLKEKIKNKKCCKGDLITVDSNTEDFFFFIKCGTLNKSDLKDINKYVNFYNNSVHGRHEIYNKRVTLFLQ